MAKTKVYFPISLKILTGLLWLLSSCSSQKQKIPKLRVTPVLNNAIEQATIIYDAGSVAYSLRYLDSVYRKEGMGNAADQFEYYKFFYNVYYRDNRDSLSDIYIDSAINIIKETNNTGVLISQYAEVIFFKADLYYEQGNYNKAYEYYYQAKTIAETNSDSCTLGFYNYKIGLVLYRGGKYSEAVPYFEQAYGNFNACNSHVSYLYRQQEILDNIGLCYYHVNNYDSAIIFYNKALDLINIKRNDYSFKDNLFDKAIAVIEGNLGSAYASIGDNKKAEELYKASININDKPFYDKRDALFTRIKLAALYLDENRINEGLKLLRETEQAQDSVKSNEVALRLNNILWRYWQHENQPRKAFVSLQRYVELKDSIATANKLEQRLDIDQRVMNLQRGEMINELEKRSQLRTIYLIIATLFCSMFTAIVLLVIYNSRKSKKNVVLLTEVNAKMNDQQFKLQQVLTELEKGDKEKDRILKAVSHDMRSPINSAVALTDLLLSDSNLSAEQDQYLSLIKNSFNNALNLTKDLLQVATLHTENINKRVTNLSVLLEKGIEDLRTRLVQKKQIVELDIPNIPVELLIDAEKIYRVVYNLLSNAIKFSTAHTQITLGLENKEDGVLLTVRDEGIGIPDNMQDKIFDIFTETKRFGTAGEEPYGLGLAISKQIVEVHGGNIWLESEIGKGTIFYVFLPR